MTRVCDVVKKKTKKNPNPPGHPTMGLLGVTTGLAHTNPRPHISPCRLIHMWPCPKQCITAVDSQAELLAMVAGVRTGATVRRQRCGVMLSISP